MKRRAERVGILVAAACFLLIAFLVPGANAAEEISNDLFDKMVQSMDGKQVFSERDIVERQKPKIKLMGSPAGQMSLKSLFRTTVSSVPLVLSQGSMGSSILVSKSKSGSVAYVVTNYHVVSKPFVAKNGLSLVGLVFYHPLIAGELYSGERVKKCRQNSYRGSWCQANKKSFRVAAVATVDPNRDLALLIVKDPPPASRPLKPMKLSEISPGDDVAVIGHPRGYLWTLTKGIVSAVRTKYPMNIQKKTLGTVIQTQTPISPGNSGGPLLDPAGRVLGVITWTVGNAQGLNAAVGVDEIQAFVSEYVRKASKKK